MADADPATTLAQIVAAFVSGDYDDVPDLVRAGLEAGLEPDALLQSGLVAGIREVGEMFRRGEAFLPEMMLAAEAWEEGAAVLEPLMAGATVAAPQGKVVIGTVAGDLHDIGKNLVAMMLEGAGFEVIDLGVNVAPAKFVETAKTKGAQLVGMSALLTTTLSSMQMTIEALTEAGLRGRVKILVGGAPVTGKFASQIGADAYAPDAVSAIDAARRLIS